MLDLMDEFSEMTFIRGESAMAARSARGTSDLSKWDRSRTASPCIIFQ
jgi:hypothetical protein